MKYSNHQMKQKKKQNKSKQVEKMDINESKTQEAEKDLVCIDTIINCSLEIIQYTVGATSQNHCCDGVPTFFILYNSNLTK